MHYCWSAIVEVIFCAIIDCSRLLCNNCIPIPTSYHIRVFLCVFCFYSCWVCRSIVKAKHFSNKSLKMYFFNYFFSFVFYECNSVTLYPYHISNIYLKLKNMTSLNSFKINPKFLTSKNKNESGEI